MIYMLPLIITNGIAAAFLKFDGIDGECKDKDHKEWIEINSLNFGAAREITGAGSTRSAGPAKFKDISVSKWIDKSSPILMQSVCAGRVFPKVEIDVTAASYDQTSSNTTYITYTLENVLISSFNNGSGSSGESIPVDQFSLNFTKIEIDYSSVDDSTGEASFSTNVSCIVEDR
jgi:type VI secretion system secreted protein Hcp